MKVNAVAILAIMTAGLAFGDITVGPGDVLQVGTTGTGPNNANDNSVITLEAGATLKGVNEPSWSTWTIWRNLYATNGVAYLDCSDMTPEPRIRRHAVLTDGLVVKGRSFVMFFDDSSTTPNADWYIRDLSGVSFEGGGGCPD